MAYSARDVAKMAGEIRNKQAFVFNGQTYYLNHNNRFVIAAFMADHFSATVRYFDRIKFMADCGF